ncbi:potassium-transporting ATPase subunit C [Leucobacter massiliensis]|uniref:Potassium-transporting ATPase KdpC subunit n=1 Tax=Leucobacter massiliensis TaxID=1686285 RepID=A0A2S9QR13_9MICO|nr:potassium-transporting ATPase subunit C [Leucobacter massiliensis]
MRRLTRRLLAEAWSGLRIMLICTVLLGIAYPLVVLGIGQFALPEQATGSLLRDEAGAVRGSSLIGQDFADADGDPLPQYFQPRPSAAGYDAAASLGSNLGSESAALAAQIEERRTQLAAFNGVAPEAVPPDALTASGSGLDPHISPAYARLQAARVAETRGLSLDEVERLVERCTSGPDLGLWGEARVNVVELNLALDGRVAARAPRRSAAPTPKRPPARSSRSVASEPGLLTNVNGWVEWFSQVHRPARDHRRSSPCP